MKIKLFILFSALFGFTLAQSQTCNNVLSEFCSITEGSTTHFRFTGYETGISSYLWDFGDGNTSNLKNPSHTFSSTGSFQACLTLTCNITTTTGGGGGSYGGGGTTTTTTCTDFSCGNISISVYGCTDFNATNYNALATIDDGSCKYCIYGCTDLAASNYNPLANCDDNSCLDIISKSLHEDFESYELYDYLAFSSPLWGTWNNPFSFGCDQDVQIDIGPIDTNTNGGSKTINLKSNLASGGAQDIVLPFGSSSSYTSGIFIFSSRFNVKTDVNTGAYFNFQSDYNPGNGWALDVLMQQNGQIVFSNSQNNNLLTSTYPENIWFELKIAVNITANEWNIYIDNILIGSFVNGINQIASLNLYPLNDQHFWVDDIYYMYNANLVYGCTDTNSTNYNVTATWDDSSCIPIILGCTDSLAINYNSTANTDDLSCIPIIYGCTDHTMFNYDINANTDDGTCVAISLGCIDVLACNYNTTANTDDGLCDLPNGCGDSLYLEYDASVTCSDINVCISLIVYGCTDVIACNYNLLANTDDESCNYNSSSYDTLISNINIVWNGMTLITSGDYSVILANVVGCDSIANLSLSIINATGVENFYGNNKVLIKITDILGKETPYRRNTPLFYIYNDGTVERKLIIK